jgi:hypothetical protein
MNGNVDSEWHGTSFRCIGPVRALVEQSFDLGGILSKCHDRFWQSYKDEWARVADATLNSVLQFAPMSRGGSEFVSHKMINPSIAKRNWLFLSLDSLHDIGNLPTGAVKADSFHVGMGIDLLVVDKAADKSLHRVLKGSTTRNNDTQRDCAIGMQALEILQIAIEKWVLVIPLDLKRNCSSLERSDVVDFVRLRFSLNPVDDPLDNEDVLLPAMLGESVAKHLGKDLRILLLSDHSRLRSAIEVCR